MTLLNLKDMIGVDMKHSTRKRLAMLPEKLAVPLRKHFESHMLNHDQLQLVLDAGEIAIDQDNVLEFAGDVAMLDRHTTPVYETVEMAQKLKSRIQLDWDNYSWQDEHKALAKKITLQRLQEKKVDYDVSPFESLLPDFPGYIVSSSHRLAIIGMVQRNAIAMCHNRIVDGSCAVVCIFLQGVRWTVELARSSEESHCLEIGNIRTYDNVFPDLKTARTIYKMLGLYPGFWYRRKSLRDNILYCGVMVGSGIGMFVLSPFVIVAILYPIKLVFDMF